jgi:hypothetical protein
MTTHQKKITISANGPGPYLVTGKVPLAVQSTETNEGESTDGNKGGNSQ